MIKNALKTFGKNLIYVFIPMGILYLIFILAVATFALSAAGDIGTALKELAELVHVSSEQSSASVNEFLAYSFGKIDWDASLFSIVGQMLDLDWLKETVYGFFATLNADTEGFGTQALAILQTLQGRLAAAFSLAVASVGVGIMLAIYATRFAVRRRSAKRGVKKFLLSHTVVPIAQTLVFYAFFALFSVIKLYGFLALVALLALLGILALLSSWLLHGREAMKFRDVLTARNLVQYAAVLGIFVLIDVAVALSVFFIDPILCVLITVPFAIYTLCIADIATDAYILSLAEAKGSGK